MTDPIKTVEADLEAVKAKIEADAAAEDAAIAKAVRDMKDRAIRLWVDEFERAHEAEMQALAWARARRAALIGIGLGILLIVIGYLV